jgi:mono/diheme cytochrome c family protein
MLELIIDPACSIVFEGEPEEEDVMQRPPRDPQEPFFRARTIWTAVLQGTLALLLTCSVLVFAVASGYGEACSRTLTFATLVLANLGLILANRSSARGAVAALLLGAATVVLGATSARADPGTGELLYLRYCAACHGESGRGDGPAGAALCPKPSDLTRLDSDVGDLMRHIDGRRTIRAHGTAAMPVWGMVFEQSLITEPRRRRTALQQVEMLADYVRRLRGPAAATPAAGARSPAAH